MKPHQQRVVEEKAELDERLDKLQKFIQGDVFLTIDPFERVNLRDQSRIMAEYSRILGVRIDNFRD